MIHKSKIPQKEMDQITSLVTYASDLGKEKQKPYTHTFPIPTTNEKIDHIH